MHLSSKVWLIGEILRHSANNWKLHQWQCLQLANAIANLQHKDRGGESLSFGGAAIEYISIDGGPFSVHRGGLEPDNRTNMHLIPREVRLPSIH